LTRAGSIGLTVATADGIAVLTGDVVPSAKSLRRDRTSAAVSYDNVEVFGF
jgi:N-acyl homoserine lactone hydrolase